MLLTGRVNVRFWLHDFNRQLWLRAREYLSSATGITRGGNVLLSTFNKFAYMTETWLNNPQATEKKRLTPQ